MQGLRLNPGNIRKPEHIKAGRERSAGPRPADPHRRQRRLARSRRSPSSTAASRPRRSSRRRSASSTYFAEVGFDDVKISVKASNVPLMIDAYRLLVGDRRPSAAPRRHRSRAAAAGPDQVDGRHRDAARRGHRRHDPLLAHRRPGRGGQGRPPAARGAGSARAQGPRPHRVPVVRARRGRRDPASPRGAGRARRAQHPAPGRGDGLRRERAAAKRAKPTSASPAGAGKGHLFVKGHVVRAVPEAEMVAALVDEAEKHHGRRASRRASPPRRERGAIAAAERDELAGRSRASARTTSAERVAHSRDDLRESTRPADRAGTRPRSE